MSNALQVELESADILQRVALGQVVRLVQAAKTIAVVLPSASATRAIERRHSESTSEL